MSSKNDLMDIMEDSAPTTSAASSTLKNTKKQLYNAIGDKIPSLKIDSIDHKSKVSKKTTSASKWSYSSRLKHRGIYYKQWIKGSVADTADIDITYKYDKYNHKYKVPYFASEEVFNKAVSAYREANIPNVKESLKLKFEKEKEAFELKKASERLEKQSRDKEKDKQSEESSEGISKETSVVEEKEEELAEPDYDLRANELLDNTLRLLSFSSVQQIMDLAKDYDLKWAVVQDRFNMDNMEKNIQMSVPEVKYVFYKSCTIFFQYNNRSELNSLLNFDLDADINRQRNLERLFNRSAAEVAEEEALILEAKKFEVTSKKIKEERDSIVKLLDYPKTQQSFVPEQFLSASGFSQLYKSLMKMRSSSNNNNKFSKFPENPWKLQFSKFKSQKQKFDPELKSSSNGKEKSETTAAASDTDENGFSLNPILKTLVQRSGHNISQVNSKNEMIYELVSNLTDFEKDKLHIEIKSPMYTQSGISLNSNKLAINKPSVESKIDKLYQELQIPPKPIMMTSNLIKGYNILNGVLLECINIKQSLDKLEAEAKIKSGKK